ncbi:MAG: DUF2807 domain-containing protein [Muribaculaceae bacterium]|nr:DUF2807 domain-containing protein [Muribaculaceae bacterium]
MKKLISLLIALMPLCLGAKNYEIRAEKSIQSIVNASEADVELIYSTTGGNRIVYSSSEIEAPLKVSVSPFGKLTIDTNRKKSYKVSKVKVYYTGKLNEITNSGTGDIETGLINTPGELKLINSGTGDLEISKVNVKKLRIVNSGTGDIEVKGGKTIDLKVVNSGTGDIEAKVKSSTSDIVNSGTGDISGIRQSTASMKIANTGIGKIAVKKQSNGCQVVIAPNGSRNVSFVR